MCNQLIQQHLKVTGMIQKTCHIKTSSIATNSQYCQSSITLDPLSEYLPGTASITNGVRTKKLYHYNNQQWSSSLAALLLESHPSYTVLPLLSLYRPRLYMYILSSSHASRPGMPHDKCLGHQQQGWLGSESAGRMPAVRRTTARLFIASELHSCCCNRSRGCHYKSCRKLTLCTCKHHRCLFKHSRFHGPTVCMLCFRSYAATQICLRYAGSPVMWRASNPSWVCQECSAPCEALRPLNTHTHYCGPVSMCPAPPAHRTHAVCKENTCFWIIRRIREGWHLWEHMLCKHMLLNHTQLDIRSIRILNPNPTESDTF